MRQVTIGAKVCVIGEQVTVWCRNERGHRTHGQGGKFVRIASSELCVVIETPFQGEQFYALADHEIVREVPFDLDECIQYQEEVCRGNVEHFSPDGRGSAPLRCEFHIEQRAKSYENSIERYAHSDVAPDWFDPSAAGERWDED